MTVKAFAPAKVNLTLHVTGQRSDGYHLLDSLVVFLDIGDVICANHAALLKLTVDGPEAIGLGPPDGNLVLRAARAFNSREGASIRLTKNLPIASGLGGGSSDAAAAVRALSTLWNRPIPEHGTLLDLGADVPVCVANHPQRMRGIGERLSRVLDMPAMELVLVNPRVPVSTPSVFRAVARKDNPPMPEKLPKWRDLASLAAWLTTQRNDLLAAAVSHQPIISDVLDSLRKTQCLFAGMSGSGATCFAIYPPDGKASDVANVLGMRGWWAVNGTVLA
ncbi:4-(cytidine 5'-diphospho)-2-C-methyl-D-erythritol kinase [Pseudopelagicola sp. nBUS_19]|mgnify:CR=1 FL=1|uniref:4-(cytidine 5'-diphospho)-2-C-methyl-D-erythritol kinase n=1 Tax=Pseudopelagicola sp. nBUS_19 TaxID=3395316 RepID=UPI003EBB3EC6